MQRSETKTERSECKAAESGTREGSKGRELHGGASAASISHGGAAAGKATAECYARRLEKGVLAHCHRLFSKMELTFPGSAKRNKASRVSGEVS